MLAFLFLACVKYTKFIWGLNKTVIFFIPWIALKTMQSMNTKQDRHVYVMSSDHGNSDGGGTGDIGSDEYSHYKAL